MNVYEYYSFNWIPKVMNISWVYMLPSGSLEV